jgi:hypothetical protein
MQPTEDKQAARNFFIAYYGPRPQVTGYRTMAERNRWYSILSAFIDAEWFAENLKALRENYQCRRAANDPLAGMTEVEVEKAEAAREKAAELRAEYEAVLTTGELPEYWRGYSGRPGAKRAARDFEKYLADKKRRQPDQAVLFN